MSEDQSGNIVYTAAYTANGIPSTITWQNEDGTVLKTESIPYGELPVYSGTVPAKAPRETESSCLPAGAPDVTAVTGDATYTAIFDKVLQTLYDQLGELGRYRSGHHHGNGGRDPGPYRRDPDPPGGYSVYLYLLRLDSGSGPRHGR